MWRKQAIIFIRNLYNERGYAKIKKGRGTSHSSWEIRFSTLNAKERKKLRKAMRLFGFKCGKQFKKHSRIIVPYYGYNQLTTFFKIIRPRRKRIPTK